ncbi:CPBP family intramembrane glutamic endopeptidase [Paeniglutamicibacter psychrophenolicus]|uniref:CPBP family intramembrane glutamic endopeptidase n=1 Tax=Paeniglutamicibacter psychrophenolicus TaxID=257454 RepID=UPI0027841FFA|nr:CPBP family intramembrane glutamic endopeptidase [Paeniglutamicibacter psychrophenolicus]MDQ0094878.1 membrane protease YdiL (CAAX protease family) [Paeniglutamicibacter psychrophenolicus]
MNALNRKSPIWHAVIWIVAYVVLVNLGDWLSELIGGSNLATPLLLVAFSIGLVFYVARNGWLNFYGLGPLRRRSFTGTWLYIPLVVIVSLQFFKGFKENLDVTAVLLIVVLMICVGFIEELLFRGFLFKGILAKGTLARAVLISGVTFGIGHVVNLARGYTGTEQLLQIGFGILLGIVLALLFAVTGTIIPFIIFHVLFNISGNLTAENNEYNFWMLLATVVISIGYGGYLVGRLRRHGADQGVREPMIPAAREVTR